MNEEAKKFIASGILEEYLLGFTTSEQNRQVEEYLSKYPEVKKHFDSMQEEIETYADKLAYPAPEGSKDSIMKAIDRLDTERSSGVKQLKSFRGAAIAAGILALLSCSLAFLQWNNAQNLLDQKQTLQEKYEVLKSDCENQNAQYASLEKQQALLKHPATQKILLAGNQKTPTLQSVAFWNNEAQVAHLDMVQHPDIPDDHCLQLWADVDGKMVNLGVLPKTAQLIDLPFLMNATSLNITIEPLGGSEHPTVSRLVASQALEIG